MTIDESCVEVYPPGVSASPNVGNVADSKSSGNELALARHSRWQPGQELRIAFLDGDAEIWTVVEKYSAGWLEHANIGFVFGDFVDAELRITFRGTGNWSYVGNAARQIHPSEPTMQLGGLTVGDPPDHIRRKVLHEFGHALGCVHEQSSPAASIRWDVDAVYRYFRSIGWSDDKIALNVLSRHHPRDTDFSLFDPESIMQYPVAAWMTLDGVGIDWNTDLSARDKQFIAELYPSD